MDYFFVFSLHFDFSKELSKGRLSINSLSKGTIEVFVATSSQADQMQPESFHTKGGLIPPQYRCGILFWQVNLIAIEISKRAKSNFYQILPYAVVTDAGTVRGDFGIHSDADVLGSFGCITLPCFLFPAFEVAVRKLVDKGIREVPLFVQYS